MSGCKFNKKKGVILSKKTRNLPMGMDAELMLDTVERFVSCLLLRLEKEGVEDPIQALLNTALSSVPAGFTPPVKHAFINKLKELNSSS